MARGNSKGIVTRRLIGSALDKINRPFTASDILDIMCDFDPRPKNIPSIREIGAVLKTFVTAGNIVEVGKAVPTKYRQMIENAGLYQRQLRKTKLYIKVGDLATYAGDSDDC